MATRTASSGLMSTLARPRTPSRPNRWRAPRDSQTIEELMMAPGSTVLNGYTFTDGLMTACSPTKHSSPSTTPSSHRAPLRRSLERPTTAPRRRTAGAEVGVVVDDGPLEVGVGPDPHVAAEHRVLPEVGARLHPAVVADDRRAVELGRRVDLGALAQPHALAHLEALDADLDLAVEDVLVGLDVGLEGADVLPVALGDVAEEPACPASSSSGKTSSRSRRLSPRCGRRSPARGRRCRC